MTGPTSLFTCRYWAFGPGCPNIAHGDNICQFAHWDTGRLASSYDQRGTCKFWLQGNCVKGHACWYEHRNTGVEGLYQGRITLTGFNLEVATAAGNAGFDTFNHVALFDLIWAVKRIAFRASRGAIIDRPRPPKDPVYPDRFRPSGMGDNTKRKRPAQPYVPPQQAPVKLEVMVKPLQKQQRFRYRNTQISARSKPAHTAKPTGYATQGTQENPVEVLSDDDNVGNVVAKRQKLDAATCSRHKPSANTSQARIAQETVKRTYPDTDALVEPSDAAILDTMQVDGQTYVRAPRKNYALDERETKSLQAEMRKVRDVLQATVKDMTTCNDSMSTAFVQYRDIMSRKEVHSSLTALSNSFETVKTASLEGVGHLDDIMALLSRV